MIMYKCKLGRGLELCGKGFLSRESQGVPTVKLETLKRSTTMEHVLEVIRNAILDGTFSPGSQLKQSVIAQELQVSQGLVREALNRMIEEGLVLRYPYRGMFVTELTERDVEEIYCLRSTLERLALRLALPHFSRPEVLETAERLSAEVTRAARMESPDAAALADLAFHRYLIGLSGNSRLIKAWDAITSQAKYLLRNLYAVEPDAEAVDHTDWVAQLRAGDLQALEAFVEEQMQRTQAKILDLWPILSEHSPKAAS